MSGLLHRLRHVGDAGWLGDLCQEAAAELASLRETVAAEKEKVERMRDLLRRMIGTARQYKLSHRKTPIRPLWSNVGMFVCVGSTSAAKLCREMGFDPDTGEALAAALAETETQP
ncbi:MAG TPA: hypothetical protein VM223_00210 [Planctomycetota bacterium]|nr:hypothetical protein [Planctomycetota bacterium]